MPISDGAWARKRARDREIAMGAQTIAAQRHGLCSDDVTARTRTQPTLRARQMAAWLAHAEGASLPNIGAVLGLTHGGVWRAVRAARRFIRLGELARAHAELQGRLAARRECRCERIVP